VPGVTQGFKVGNTVVKTVKELEVTLQVPGVTEGVKCLVDKAELIELGTIEQV
jgi:hypothetical protein